MEKPKLVDIERAVYRPAHQDVTVYEYGTSQGKLYEFGSRFEIEEFLAMTGFTGELEEDNGATVYGLLKSIGPLGGTQV